LPHLTTKNKKNMRTKQFLNRYIKRKNFLEDFTTIQQRGGFNHRYSGKDTNGNESDLSLYEKSEICDGMGELIIKATEVREELKIEIKTEQENAKSPEFESLDGLQSLSEFHHSGGELVEGMEVLLERNRRTKLVSGVLKSWQIGEVKNDITGYGKYASSEITVLIDGVEKQWPFLMTYHKV
jgi:hypothetical protein